MQDQSNIQVGDTARAITNVWREDEQPDANNFFTGQIAQIKERNPGCWYVRFWGQRRWIPVDRISLIQAARPETTGRVTQLKLVA